MSWLRDTLGVYGRVLRRAFQLTVTHWWLGLVAVAYQLLLLVVGFLTAMIPLLGPFLFTIAAAALFSSWLVLMGHVVRSGRATLRDIRQSYLVYLGDVLTFGFFMMILFWLWMNAAVPGFELVWIVFGLALFVFLSAVPEEIYLGGQSGLAILVESYRFVATNWIEWLPATAALVVVTGIVTAVPFWPLAIVMGGIGSAFMFIARGLLFLELNTSSRRAREFQRRAAG